MYNEDFAEERMSKILTRLRILSSEHKKNLKYYERKTKNKYDILIDFLSIKKLEGCSIETIVGYYNTLYKFVGYIHKEYKNITADDLREYLINYQSINSINNRTLDDIRRCISSFFNYLEMEEIIQRNPTRKIHKIKYEKVVKKPFSDIELERIRDSCKTLRDRALIDLLVSSGCRVSEVVRMDIDDFDMEKREIIVYGKGGKERVVYIDARTKLHVQQYLDSRTDSNKALFVTKRAPFNRLSKNVIESIVRQIAKEANVENAHPHRFRRTLATSLINKGMPIEQVQMILGHSKLETTTIYAQVNQESVKMNHSRYTM